ncbi:MAG: hypothetical protein RIQ93_1936 [Verrucomicrobiota bacterium]
MGLGGVFVARGEEEVVNSRDTLVYKDGDRVQGTLISTGKVIVFKSDRFGELQVPGTDAVVIKAEQSGKSAVVNKAAPPPAGKASPAVAVAPVKAASSSTAPAPKPSAEHAEQVESERVTIWDRFSPSVLTAKVRNYFGPWHGRLALSTEAVSDIAERNNVALDGQLKRKWEKHDVQVNARYDFARTNNLPTTDLIKGSALWRYDITKKQFAQYRPSVEWNRASKRQGVPNEYVLMQQEIGVGYNVITTPSRKLRTGVSQNLFEIWNTAPKPDHTSRGVQSGFEEIELRMPWRMGLTQRGVWYPVRDRRDGWENRIEINKKLTETLSTSVRHEMRRNNPDGSSQDYTRLKLLFGFDF